MLPPGGQTEVTALGVIFKTALMAEPLKVAETKVNFSKIIRNTKLRKARTHTDKYEQKH